MREILFRGKRLDNCKWVMGFYVQHRGVAHYILDVQHGGYEDINGEFFVPRWYGVAPSTVGQFTGLTDKNGQRIFEGDICRFREWRNGDMCWIGKVHYECQQFVISGGPNKECDVPFELRMSRFIPENISVIGNIHDNPELLEEVKCDG